MTSRLIKVQWFLPVGTLALGISLMAMPAPRGQDGQAAPDNTRQNNQTAPNADQQGMNTSDREITQRIRKSITADKDLSSYAHNVKVITRNGKVTLRGPVRSDDEKSRLQAKATEVVSAENVTNECQVKQ